MTLNKNPQSNRKTWLFALAFGAGATALAGAYIATLNPNEIYHQQLSKKLQSEQVAAAFKEYGIYANLQEFDPSTNNVQMQVGLIERCTGEQLPAANVVSTLNRAQAVQYLVLGRANVQVDTELVTGDALKGNLGLKRAGFDLNLDSGPLNIGVGEISQLNFKTEVGKNFQYSMHAQGISTMFGNVDEVLWTFEKSSKNKQAGEASSELKIQGVKLGEIPLVQSASIISAMQYENDKATLTQKLDVQKIGLPQGELRALTAQFESDLKDTSDWKEAYTHYKRLEADCSIEPQALQLKQAELFKGALIGSSNKGLSVNAQFNMDFSEQEKAQTQIQWDIDPQNQSSPKPLGQRARFKLELKADAKAVEKFTNLGPASVGEMGQLSQVAYTYSPEEGFKLNNQALQDSDPVVLQLLTRAIEDVFYASEQHYANESPKE